ncbi:MAG: hypothetical protein WCA38_02535 [Candidatus Acidiferrales bacterium]
MKASGFLSAGVLFLAVAIPSILAQSQQEVRHAPDGGTKLMIFSISIPPLANAPFTAVVRTEWSRQLDDGTATVIKNHRTVVRDSRGRIFQERRYLTPDGDQRQTGISQLEFSDPTSREQYICKPGEHVCELRNYSASTTMVFSSVGVSNSGAHEPKSEDLGHQFIEGLDTLGTRETTTLPQDWADDNQTHQRILVFVAAGSKSGRQTKRSAFRSAEFSRDGH